MEKIKRFVECYIPTETCNLRCHYCYITQKRKFNNEICKLEHSDDFYRKAFSKRRLGGSCIINLCAGGETLLSDDVIKIIKILLEEGHYLMVVTNGTITRSFDKIAQFKKELLKRLMIKFSFHYLELKNRNMLDIYFSNVKKIKDAGGSFSIEITPSDELVPYIDEVKEQCIKNVGALCHVTIARNDKTSGIDLLSKYGLEEYKKIWSTFESPLFKFKSEIIYKKRNEYCHAGEWSIYVDMGSGDIKQCYRGETIGNIYKYLDEPLNYKAIGHGCREPYCYNGHAFLTLGNIEELNTPTLSEMRDRNQLNGETWLGNTMRKALNSKLKDSNK